MARLEIIMPERGSAVDGNQVWLFSQSSVSEFSSRINEGLPIRSSEKISLKTASQMLSPLRINSAEILDLANQKILESEFVEGTREVKYLLFDQKKHYCFPRSASRKKWMVEKRRGSLFVGCER